MSNKRPKIPPLCGTKEVAEILGITRYNVPNTRKTKGFPDPITYIGTRPVWLQSDIIAYKEKRKSRRSEDSSE